MVNAGTCRRATRLSRTTVTNGVAADAVAGAGGRAALIEGAGSASSGLEVADEATLNELAAALSAADGV
jgi:hypothetical protein